MTNTKRIALWGVCVALFAMIVGLALPFGGVTPARAQCEDARSAQPVGGGEMAWSVHERWRQNMAKPNIDDQNWVISDDVKVEKNNPEYPKAVTMFRFPVTGGTFDTATKTGNVTLGGSVQSQANIVGGEYMVDFTMKDIAVEMTDPTSGVVKAHLLGRPLDGDAVVDHGTVTFAQVKFETPQVSGDTVTLKSSSVTLTSEGQAAFGYGVGDEMDPLQITAKLGSGQSAAPQEKPRSAEKPGKAFTEPKTNKVRKGAQLEQTENPGCGDPQREVLVTGGTLTWGFYQRYLEKWAAMKELDFRQEVTGGAAYDKGMYTFQAVGGKIDTRTKKGFINYKGSVRFLAYGEKMNLLLKDPTLIVKKGKGELHAYAVANDKRGKRTEYGYVHLGNVYFSGLKLDQRSLSFTDASVTLTRDATEPMGSYWEADTVLDPLASTVSLKKAEACGPAAWVWITLIVAAVILLVTVGAVVWNRKRGNTPARSAVSASSEAGETASNDKES